MADLINAKDWKRYIKWVASENKKIDKVRKAQYDQWTADNEERRKKSAEWEAQEKIRRQEYDKAQERKLEAYNSTPWYKSKPAYPYHSYLRFRMNPYTFTVTWPIPIPSKQPSIEEYLTWLTMPATTPKVQSAPDSPSSPE